MGRRPKWSGFCAHLWRPVLTTMVKCTAIADAGLTKQTLYEVEREHLTRRPMTAQLSRWTVNGEIEASLTKLGAGADYGEENHLRPAPSEERPSLETEQRSAPPSPSASASWTRSVQSNNPVPSARPLSCSATFLNVGEAGRTDRAEAHRRANRCRTRPQLLVDASFVPDRMEATQEQNAAFREMIRLHGQSVPILVRPKPKQPDRFEVAFGHRRLRAARELGIKVRAVVRDLRMSNSSSRRDKKTADARTSPSLSVRGSPLALKAGNSRAKPSWPHSM